MKQLLKCLILVSLVAIACTLPAGGQPKPKHPSAKSAGNPVAIKAAIVPAPAPQPVLTPHQQLLQQAGVDPADWAAATYIFDHESGWCPTKSEGEIGLGCPAAHGYTAAGYGMCQSTPAIKMAVEGPGWDTDPVLQIKWCSTHAAQYGGWQGAYQHWLAYHNW